MLRFPLILLLSFWFVELANAQYKYPVTREHPVADNYFGTQIIDNYRWLENLKNPEVQTWFKEQADFSNNILRKINGRDELIKSLKQVQGMYGDVCDNIIQRGNVYFYAKRRKDEKLSKLYSIAIPDGKENLLFDPETIESGTQLVKFTVSEDGKMIAVSFSQGGAEICDIRILDVLEKKLLPDVVSPTWSEFNFEFTSEGESLVYSKMNTNDPSSDDLLKNTKAFIHQLGANSKNDKIIASLEKYPELNILPEQFPQVYFSADYKYIFLQLESAKIENLVYYASVSELKNEKIDWKPLIKLEDEITKYHAIGNQLYFLTHKNAPNYKICVTTIGDTDFSNAKIIVPESKKVIPFDDFRQSKNYLYYSLNDGVDQEIFQLDPQSFTTKKLPLPKGINTCSPFNKRQNDKLLISNSGWLTPNVFYEYDAQTGLASKSKWFNLGNNFPDYEKQYEIKEMEIPSYDGVMVPLSLIYPKNIRLDGSNPCYIYGYGAYGLPNQPRFVNTAMILLEHGVILAFAHVRGGGEKGDVWHKAGQKDTKPNTWKDFIACSEYLIKEKYTSPQKLIGKGVSMGGILIGRAITERPDLFKVAIVEVGATNTIRSEITANGPNQIPEIGTLQNEQDCKNLIEMDAQSKVKKGIKYPAVLVRTGMNDSRIVPWM
ncbi:MAG TPA: prolyl oligopeptidase family serine peptidase, partial [Bacteroidia bacterium]|nr:prolyl oligopeptidase family serine peptidase [Bacteroidia bacterium]